VRAEVTREATAPRPRAAGVLRLGGRIRVDLAQTFLVSVLILVSHLIS